MSVVYIVLAFVISICIAGYFYKEKLKSKEKVGLLLTFLRFCSLFCLCLLFINPQIESSSSVIENPSLVLLVDDSESISTTNQLEDVRSSIGHLTQDNELTDRFNIHTYKFSNELSELDSLGFKGRVTNINNSLQQINSTFTNSVAPIILLTDGNQTIGKPYKYYNSEQPIYSVILGDTTTYEDVGIDKLNTNRFAFLDNNFPVELFLSYTGNSNVNLTCAVYKEGRKVYNQKVSFSSNNKSEQLSFHLPATEIGKHYYSVEIESLTDEKNIVNNRKEFVVEVVDERAKVLILISFLHPDLGSLKKSIEKNKQRSVEIKRIEDEVNLSEYQSVILYQPNSKFRNTFYELEQLKLNYLIITGTQTDWHFLNNIQDVFGKNAIPQTENYFAAKNQSFDLFSYSTIDFSIFPPLLSQFGNMSIDNGVDILLYQQIGNYTTQQPLLFFYEADQLRVGVLVGENSWRWRSQYNLSNGNTDNYDAFIGRIIQYLSVNQQFEKLSVDVNSIYTSNEIITFSVNYLDETYQFNNNAKIWLTIYDSNSNEIEKLPFRLLDNQYVVNVSEFSEGEYNYTVSVENTNENKKGSFKVIDFNIEQQYLSANSTDLRALSVNSEGAFYTLNQIDELSENLLTDKRFLPRQRLENKKHSLINWKWLLGVIIISLSIEWFIRKYRGLI